MTLHNNIKANQFIDLRGCHRNGIPLYLIKLSTCPETSAMSWITNCNFNKTRTNESGANTMYSVFSSYTSSTGTLKLNELFKIKMMTKSRYWEWLGCFNIRRNELFRQLQVMLMSHPSDLFYRYKIEITVRYLIASKMWENHIFRYIWRFYHHRQISEWYKSFHLEILCLRWNKIIAKIHIVT